jgi:hypothetical protein
VAYVLPSFLEGTGTQLLDLFEQALGQISGWSAFQESLWRSDAEILRAFYELGPQRNFRLRAEAGIQGPLILQEELDDLLVSVGPKLRPNDEPQKEEPVSK